MVGNVAGTGEIKNAFKIFVGNPQRMNPAGRHCRR
jgi:hypothetical protein